MDSGDLENRFNYHAPTGRKKTKHDDIRAGCLELADIINVSGPDCREKSTAISRLEEAMMWANAMVARHPEE